MGLYNSTIITHHILLFDLSLSVYDFVIKLSYHLS